MATIRERKNGTFELRVVHKALDKPYYTSHDTRAEADAYARRLVALLDKGLVPPELAPARPTTRVASVLDTYLAQAQLAASDRPTVQTLAKGLAHDLSLEQVTLHWATAWVGDMKRQDRLAPGTIRKRVECLARAIDWWNRRTHDADSLPANPLRLLPRGYSAYRPGDGPPRVDTSRDRRLEPGEQEKIEAVILGQVRPDRQRALDVGDRQAFLLFFRLLVATGLRLREAYTLRVLDLQFQHRTIVVRTSKTGRGRQVPMAPAICDWLFQHLERTGAQDLVFPYWAGTQEDLRRCTMRLSSQFSRVFAYAGVQGLTEHDLRHEAVCRWMGLKDSAGRWLYRPEEVRRITGHRSEAMFMRYLSLRGSDLAERLWQ